MATIKPFRAVRYNLQRIDDLGQVVAPPYDVIGASQREELMAQHPNNFVNLILGEPGDEEWHSRAAKEFRSWLDTGVLIRDDTPGLYILEHEFGLGDGSVHVRRAIVAAVRIEEADNRTILGHERVFDGPLKDRFALLEAAAANLSPIFSCYSDETGEVASFLDTECTTRPIALFETNDGARHRLWHCTDRTVCESITDLFADKTVFIADGHHRYATSRNYRDQMRAVERDAAPIGEEPYDFVMMALVAFEDPGLVVLPCHRLLHSVADVGHKTMLDRLAKDFEVEPLDGAAAMSDISQQMAERTAPGMKCFTLILPGHPPYLLRTRDLDQLVNHEDTKADSPRRRLDVTLLHQVLLPEYLGVDSAEAARKRTISYTQDASVAGEAVNSGRAQAAVLLNPTSPADVREVASAGELMPHKTTYFYPKFCSGVTVYSHER